MLDTHVAVEASGARAANGQGVAAARRDGVARAQRVRNSEMPDAVLGTPHAPPPPDDSLRRELEMLRHHRAQRYHDLEDVQRERFAEEARTTPDRLYDRLVRRRRRRLYDDAVDVLRPDTDFILDMLDATQPIVVAPPPEGVGEMWWGETVFIPPARLGMHGVFTNDGLLLLGRLNWDDGDLFQSSLRVISSFFLPPARMPAATRVRSAPGGVLSGQMFGFTGGSPLFGGAFDGDQWSKCRLRLHQRATAVNPANPVDAIPATPFATSEIQIIDIDDGLEMQTGNLSGGLPYPPVEIVLDKHRILRIDLEIELAIALEGEAMLRFGSGEADTPALHQLSQWTLQSL